MELSEIAERLDSITRPQLAGEWDRVGLLAGSPESKISRVLVALDVDENVVRTAVRKKAGLIVSHHPLFLRPLEKIVADSRPGKILHALIRNRIALYCAHTNLDLLPWGTSLQLCRKLGLEYLGPLQKAALPEDRKIVTFVPPDHTERVRRALAENGAGTIGKYDFCSFRGEGEGSFLPRKGARPAVGKTGKQEFCREDKLEMVVPADQCARAVAALKKAHPYEEPAIDVLRLEGNAEGLGWGALARLSPPVKLQTWSRQVKKRLRANSIRVYRGKPGRTIRTIALMPGSGSAFLRNLPAQADAFLSGDLKYHDIHEYSGSASLLDAGHDATERPVLAALRTKIQSELGLAAEIAESKNMSAQIF